MKSRYLVIGVVLLIAAAIGMYFFALSLSGASNVASMEKVHVLIVRNPPALNRTNEAFVERMTNLGYVEGDTISYMLIDVGTDLESTKKRIADAISQKQTNLIFTVGIIATRAAKETTTELDVPIPVVFGVVSDPVGSGLVYSIKTSANNLTGITPASEVAASKKLELLREAFPESKRVIYAWNDEKTAGVSGVRDVASKLGLILIEKHVKDVVEMNSFVESFRYKAGDVILRSSDGVAAGALTGLVQTSIDHRIPLIGTNSGDTMRGALMSYGADYGEIGKEAARMVDAVLRGTLPSAIPIEEAPRFDLSINLKTAKQIGVSIPQSILLKTSILVPET